MATFPRRGEVWLVQFPDDPKSRPALIVSPDVRNELATSVLAVRSALMRDVERALLRSVGITA
jgi:mRNA-degrading endonuclease toxin of MazEF toxin-antitoxin module